MDRRRQQPRVAFLGYAHDARGGIAQFGRGLAERGRREARRPDDRVPQALSRLHQAGPSGAGPERAPVPAAGP